MKERTKHITTLIGLAALLWCMALPSFLKLAHALHGHKDIRCHRESRLHIHSAEFDCDFQKFNKTTVFIHQPLILETAPAECIFAPPGTREAYVFSAPPLSFSLRAPPQIS